MIASAEQNRIVRGFEGVPPLMILMSFDLFLSFAINALHNVFLDVSKQLLKLWCEAKYNEKAYSVRKKRRT